MRLPVAACSAALSGALVLAMIGAAAGVEPGPPVLPVRVVRAAAGVRPAVPTTPAAAEPTSVTGATYVAAVVQLDG